MTSMNTENEVVKTETVAVKKYEVRQATSFAAVGGGPAGWRATPIKDIQGFGRKAHIIFDLPIGYQTVTPWSDLNDQKGNSSACQLCGWAPLVNYWPIQNDSKQLLMWVGVECVGNFTGAKYLTKQVKTFKETKLRKAFDGWVKSAYPEIEKHKTRRSWQSQYSDGWLDGPYFEFRKTLYKAEALGANKLGAIKIRNIFKKARALGIPIPDGIIEAETEPNVEAPKEPYITFDQMVARGIAKEIKTYENGKWTVRRLD